MKRLFGGLLIAAGVLIATLSGLCTAMFVGSILPSATRGSTGVREIAELLEAVGLFGGLPFALGVGLIVAGVALIRRPKSAPQPSPPPLDDRTP